MRCPFGETGLLNIMTPTCSSRVLVHKLPSIPDDLQFMIGRELSSQVVTDLRKKRIRESSDAALSNWNQEIQVLLNLRVATRAGYYGVQFPGRIIVGTVDAVVRFLQEVMVYVYILT